MREPLGGHPIGCGGARPARPGRAAALDMGSNAIRYSIADVTGDYPEILESGRFPIRLGHDVFLAGELSPRTSEAVVRAMADFRTRMEIRQVERYRAIATSAIRDSRNGAEVVEAIRRETGIDLEVISGDEEARLVWVAVRAKLGLDRPALLADLGGGSLEISLIDGDRIRWTESYPLGAVRLLEAFGADAEDDATVVSQVDAIAGRVAEVAATGDTVDLILTGGNADAIADLVDGGTDPDRTTTLGLRDLSTARERLRGLSVAERVSRLGLREDRADVIATAAIIFKRLAELAKSERVIVPRVGVQHGLLAGIALARSGAD